MNRHGILNLLLVVGFLLVLTATTAILIGAFYAPTATTDLVTPVGIVVASIVWSAIMLAFIAFGDRIHTWARHRYELSDQSPDTSPGATPDPDEN